MGPISPRGEKATWFQGFVGFVRPMALKKKVSRTYQKLIHTSGLLTEHMTSSDQGRGSSQLRPEWERFWVSGTWEREHLRYFLLKTSLLNTDRARTDHRHNSIQVALGESMVKRIAGRNLGDTGICLREKPHPSNEGHSWKSSPSSLRRWQVAPLKIFLAPP